MKIDLNMLCHMVENNNPLIKATALPEQNQIAVTFENRPEVEIALLTPWYKMLVKRGNMTSDDIAVILQSIKNISDIY